MINKIIKYFKQLFEEIVINDINNISNIIEDNE